MSRSPSNRGRPRIFAFALAAVTTALVSASILCPTPANAATVWLCKPGLESNPCAVSMADTALYADGKSKVESPRRPKSPPIDCFYVYPTVSNQQTGNSNLKKDPEQISVAQDQASRFSAKCKVYAPMYRQLTKAGSMLQTSPPTTTPDPELAYRDVRSAWMEYLRKFNRGRGVILLGSSQGAKNLTRLVQEEIDEDSRVRRKLVSAMIIGAAVLVPEGSDVGGSFERVPACRRVTQTGCVIAYNTYPSTPPLNAFFGITLEPGMRVLCVNPNGLAPGTSGPALPYVPTARLAYLLPPAGFSVPRTRWVSLPDMYSTQCLSNATHTWLQANDVGPAGDSRPGFGQALGPRYGFHQVDITLNLGSLVRLAGSQATAWKKKQGRQS
ncbi:MAG: DUF3089 domain-containing protein [Solirubrobacterales bacterium]